ncbi:MAG: TolC family protein [Parachlamydiaceae bacterium]|nr:TolC family protein [Parachlamydiaceae bacterium]
MKSLFNLFSFKLLFILPLFISDIQLFGKTLPPSPQVCRVDEASRDVLTLGDLINTALTNNPATQVTWWNAQRAVAAVGSAKSAYYPKISFNGSVTHSRDFQFINGPDANSTILSANVVLEFLVADYGERAANVQAFMMALTAAGWESEWAIQKVMAEVFENGYSTIYAKDTLEALQLSQEDAKKMLDTANHLNQVGLSPISDVYSSKAALAQIEIEVAQQKSTLEIHRAKLAATLGLEADTPLRLARLNALHVPQKDISELIALAKTTRQDLMARRARLAEAIARQKKTAASYGPKLSIYGRGGADHAVRDKTNADHYQIALNLDVPLFTGFDATYQNRMAFANVKISENELLQLELNIALEVLTQSSKVESSREMLYYAKINLENAQAAYEGTLEKYQAGKESIAEVSMTLRQIVSARVRYSEINARYLISIANLAYATGTLSPYMEDKCIK